MAFLRRASAYQSRPLTRDDDHNRIGEKEKLQKPALSRGLRDRASLLCQELVVTHYLWPLARQTGDNKYRSVGKHQEAGDDP